jgi:hypothetical protein
MPSHRLEVAKKNGLADFRRTGLIPKIMLNGIGKRSKTGIESLDGFLAQNLAQRGGIRFTLRPTI